MNANVQFDYDPRLAKETRVPLVYSVTIIFTVLSFATVVLRLYTKKFILNHVRSDDYAIIVAQILSFGVTIVNFVLVKVSGVGYHIQFVQDKLPTFVQGVYSAMMVYNTTQIVTKLSLMLQYRHIFPSRNMRIVCNSGIVFLVLWGIAQQIVTSCACGVITLFNPKQVACIPGAIPFKLNAIMNMVTDFAILLIPVQPVLQLQINTIRKVYLLAVMCMGLVVCAISAVRLELLVNAPGGGIDATWIMAITGALSIVETNLAIMCACIPTLRPLVKKIAPGLVGSSKDPGTYGKSSKLDDDGTRKHKSTMDGSIYIQKEVNFQSTTELRSLSNMKDPYAIDDRSSDEISLQQLQGSSSGKSRDRI